MKEAYIIIWTLVLANSSLAKPVTVEQWDVFEVSYKGPATGNPFLDVNLSALFAHDAKTVEVKGFYDGNGIYKIRFMPGETGEWAFTTKSNIKSLDKKKGMFTCAPPSGGNHGMVKVANTFHFAYDDGTAYFPIGTTAYVWHHQHDTLIAATLETLKTSPFNKIRMCALPDRYRWNTNEPRSYPYAGDPPNKWDFGRFNPEYFQELEKNIRELGKMGIQADLILFHPYDYTWGFDELNQEADILYLDYLMARVGSFRNVWWSLSNEYDLMKSKNEEQWDYYFQYIRDNDPYDHLRSIHNGLRWYDHSKTWVTHLSLQHQNLEEVTGFRDKYQKPVLVDECGYEGNLPLIWGNLSAEEMVQRFWMGYSRGAYVTHGDSYLDKDNILFMFHGGLFKGESVSRIAFMKKIIETFPESGINPPGKGYWRERGGSFSEPDFYLYYLAYQQPSYIEVELPREHQYSVEIVDTWNMTITRYPKTASGKCKIDLPEASHLAIICRRLNGEKK